MKVLIDIREEIVEDCKERVFENALFEETDIAIKNGTPLDGLTNGEVIKTIFPDATVTQKNEYVVFLEIDRYGEPKLFDKTWWYAKWGE